MESNDWDAGCAGYRRLPRRDFLRVGSLTALGLTLPDLLRLEAVGAATVRPDGAASPQRPAPPPHPISCILLWLRRRPASLDMWDLEPEAPAAVRGPS